MRYNDEFAFEGSVIFLVYGNLIFYVKLDIDIFSNFLPSIKKGEVQFSMDESTVVDLLMTLGYWTGT